MNTRTYRSQKVAASASTQPAHQVEDAPESENRDVTNARCAITYGPGDIFATDAEALVNPVNCVGVMGAGLALAFRRRYPEHYREYVAACHTGRMRPGTVHVHQHKPGVTPRYIVAVPTKRHWRERSRLDDVAAGTAALARTLTRLRIESVAIPALGCGLGGLEWKEVHEVLERTLRQEIRHRCAVRILALRPPPAG